MSVREKQSFLTMKIDNDSLLLHDAGSLYDKEFLLLYKLDRDSLENDEGVSEFRFEKKNVYIMG